MYKLVAFAAFLAVAAAAPGYIGAPLAAPLAAPVAAPWGAAPVAAPWGAAPWGNPWGNPWGHGLVGAPLVGAPVVKTALPVATSYANTVRIASPAVVAAPAPLLAAHGYAAPLAHGW